MQQLQDNKLDSCERMIGNLDGKQTIGNQLCDQVSPAILCTLPAGT